ncbi:MAG TPA: spore germination protein GerW family protein [Thermoanaerobaculia bacterium]|nr:spore germination protein GerW family protein [Thermoanaerobaculia bacterium]
MSESQSQASFFASLVQQIPLHANAKQVYGEPVERDGTTIIPVARVQWGFGGGGLGRTPLAQGGGGGGARAYPVGFIALRDGKADFHPIHDSGSTVTLAAAGGLGLIAGLILAKLLRR